MATNVRANVPIRMGLASIPVNLSSATIPEDKNSHHYCTGFEATHPATRIKSTQSCPTCKRISHDWRKGVEGADGNVVLLTDKDIAGLLDPDTKDSIVVSAHPLEEVLQQTIPSGTAYNLAPGKGGQEGYALLAELLRRNPSKALLAEFATKSASKLWRLQLVDGVITMQSLCWPQDLRERPVIADVPVDPEMYKLGGRMLRSITTPFSAADYRDTAREARAALVGERPSEQVAPAPRVTLSLVDALRASVDGLKRDVA